MSSSTSRPPDSLNRMNGAQHRPGLTRVWDRMRAAMKRRSSATVAGDERTEYDHPGHPFARASSVGSIPDDTAITDEPIAVSSSSHPLSRPMPLPAKFEVLIPDDNDDDHSEGGDESDAEEIALPIACTSDGVNHARAQAMFAKYGLKYEPRFTRTATEPPAKIRRVQRPLKMQVRWICHGCDTEFGMGGTCSSCGHRRCNRCVRHPQDSESGSHEGSTQADQTNMPLPSREVVADTDDGAQPVKGDGALQMTSLEEALREPLEMDNGDSNSEEDSGASVTGQALLAKLQLSLCTRPCTSSEAVFKPKTQIIRRICHECNTQILPPNRAECQSCGHRRCTICPRYPPKPEKWPHGSPGDEQPSPEQDHTMLPNIQRVYRKPRQRVRYVCEHCQTTFAQREICEECGHGRCKECIRIPPRRSVPSPAQENSLPIRV